MILQRRQAKCCHYLPNKIWLSNVLKRSLSYLVATAPQGDSVVKYKFAYKKAVE